MTIFQPGDKVLVEGSVKDEPNANDGDILISIARSNGRCAIYVDATTVHRAPPEWAIVGNDEDGWPTTVDALRMHPELEWRPSGGFQWLCREPHEAIADVDIFLAREPALPHVDGVSPEDVAKVIAALEAKGAKS